MSRSNVLFLFVSICCFAQQERLISGTIVVKDASPGGVRILNLVNEKEAISDREGRFSVLAKPDDVLLFSSGHLDLMRHIVAEEDYSGSAFSVQMTAKPNQLKEVEIINGIDAVSTGILEKHVAMTPAEGRLRAARHFSVTAIDGGGVGFSFDPVINYLIGRTKRLKGELHVEQHQRAVDKMQEWYDPEYYHRKFRITAEERTAFEYFCVEDDEFRNAVLTKDRARADQRMGFLAMAFLESQKEADVTTPGKQ